MAAQSAITLENHVKLFVATKVAEDVSLEFTTGCVYVRPVKKQGSTTLGAFWVRVLQSYFPKGHFTYKKHYSASMGSEAIDVKVDGSYTLTIYLRTGLLTVEGDLVYEWFKIIFRKIMTAYDKLTAANPADYFNDQVALDIRKELQKPRRSDSVPEFTQPQLIDSKLALVSSDVRLSPGSLEFLEKRHMDFNERATPDDMILAPAREIPSSGLGIISLKDGERYIYPMWKQLLNKWLGRRDCEVYICSHHIDIERLKDVIAIAYKHRLDMRLEAIYTEPVTANGQRMTQVKSDLMRGHTSDEQLFIEYKIFNKLAFPATKNISCNFIAGVYNGVVEIMVTSATFDFEGLVRPNHTSSVTITKMLANDFQRNFLDVLSTV